MRRHVFLDRDGTIIAERHYLSDPEQVELLPGAAEGLSALLKSGYKLIVVTNQSGLGRGYFSTDDLKAVNERMTGLLAERGVEIHGLFHCPHTPDDGCDCRKPDIGMALQAGRTLGFDPADSFLVGDKACDIDLGRNIGAVTILVRTGYGAETENSLPQKPDAVVDDLAGAAEFIKSRGWIMDPQENREDARHLDVVKEHLLRSAEVKREMAETGAEAIVAAAHALAVVFQNNGKMLICGNGGSAADSQHLAAEFVSRLSSDFERRGLPALALTTDTSFITAFANDISFDGIFQRQVETFGRPEDILLGISTSGNSENVIRAVKAAREIGMKTLALIGRGGRLAEMCDIAISVPGPNTQFIQETHIAVEHLLCDLVERILFNRE